MSQNKSPSSPRDTVLNAANSILANISDEINAYVTAKVAFAEGIDRILDNPQTQQFTLQERTAYVLKQTQKGEPLYSEKLAMDTAFTKLNAAIEKSLKQRNLPSGVSKDTLAYIWHHIEKTIATRYDIEQDIEKNFKSRIDAFIAAKVVLQATLKTWRDNCEMPDSKKLDALVEKEMTAYKNLQPELLQTVMRFTPPSNISQLDIWKDIVNDIHKKYDIKFDQATAHPTIPDQVPKQSTPVRSGRDHS